MRVRVAAGWVSSRNRAWSSSNRSHSERGSASTPVRVRSQVRRSRVARVSRCSARSPTSGRRATRPASSRPPRCSPGWRGERQSVSVVEGVGVGPAEEVHPVEQDAAQLGRRLVGGGRGPSPAPIRAACAECAGVPDRARDAGRGAGAQRAFGLVAPPLVRAAMPVDIGCQVAGCAAPKAWRVSCTRRRHRPSASSSASASPSTHTTCSTLCRCGVAFRDPHARVVDLVERSTSTPEPTASPDDFPQQRAASRSVGDPTPDALLVADEFLEPLLRLGNCPRWNKVRRGGNAHESSRWCAPPTCTRADEARPRVRPRRAGRSRRATVSGARGCPERG